jgi:hypothetical protein
MLFTCPQWFAAGVSFTMPPVLSHKQPEGAVMAVRLTVRHFNSNPSTMFFLNSKADQIREEFPYDSKK